MITVVGTVMLLRMQLSVFDDEIHEISTYSAKQEKVVFGKNDTQPTLALVMLATKSSTAPGYRVTSLSANSR